MSFSEVSSEFAAREGEGDLVRNRAEAIYASHTNARSASLDDYRDNYVTATHVITRPRERARQDMGDAALW